MHDAERHRRLLSRIEEALRGPDLDEGRRQELEERRDPDLESLRGPDLDAIYPP